MCQHGEYCDILVEGKILNKLSVPGKYLELALGMSADFAKFNQNFGVIFDWKGKLREKWKGKMREKWGEREWLYPWKLRREYGKVVQGRIGTSQSGKYNIWL